MCSHASLRLTNRALLAYGHFTSSNILSDRPWCDSVFPNVSAMYGFIQREYWNVGLFRYYEPKQVSCRSKIQGTIAAEMIKAPNFLLAMPMSTLSLHGAWCYFFGGVKAWRSLDVRSYMWHWVLLTCLGITVAHVQIITRLVSVCPAMYWSIVLHLREKETYRRAILMYFVAFNIVGCIMFCNFYPWT